MISESRANVVQIHEYDLPPTPRYLHVDRPGMIGPEGTLLGEADITISSMQVGRRTPRGQALMLLTVDEPVPLEVVDRIRRAANIEAITIIKL